MELGGNIPQHHCFDTDPNFMAVMLIQQSTTVAKYYTPNAMHTATINRMDMMRYLLWKK